MNTTDSLANELSTLNWHPARIMLMAHFILSLIKVRTVNLMEIALGFEHCAQTGSNYKRLQRFLRFFDLDFEAIARLIAHWLAQEP